MKKVRININITEERHKELKHLTEATGINMTTIINLAIQEWLHEHKWRKRD